MQVVAKNKGYGIIHLVIATYQNKFAFVVATMMQNSDRKLLRNWSKRLFGGGAGNH